MSNSSGVIVVARAEQSIPLQFLEKVVTECPHGFGFSIANDKNKPCGMSSEWFSTTGKTQAEYLRNVDEVITKIKGRHRVLHFCRMEDLPELCRNPIPIIIKDTGTVICHAFVDGEFAKYSDDKEFDPGAAFCMRFLGDWINTLYELHDKDLNKLFKELEKPENKEELYPHMEPSGTLILHDHMDHTITIAQKNANFRAYDWGNVSHYLGYEPPKKEEPKPTPEPVKELSFMEKRKLLAAGKPIPKASVPEVKETKPEEPAKTEEKPEGGSEVKLDPKYGVIDGDKVRPPEGRTPANGLKQWYKDHNKGNRCPANWKDRPAIPFDELAAHSHIRKIIEGVHRVPTKSVAVEPAAAAPAASSTVLKPDKVTQAVDIFNKATYVVDPEQFNKSEEEFPSLTGRIGKTIRELATMLPADHQKLIDAGLGVDAMRDLAIALLRAKPDLLKTEPVTTQTKDTKEEEKPLSFMEKRKLAMKGKAA